tara:strand:- start:258 stop:926 length:669 start_codon:yes stop_codon:yes gene_type:complete
MHSSVSRLNIESDATAVAAPLPVTSETTLATRFEWLEELSGKIAATVNSHRSEQHDLTAKVTSSVESLEQRTQELFNDTLCAYGLVASRPIKGLRCRDGDMAKTFAELSSTGSEGYTTIAGANTWVAVSYPMQEVKRPGGHECVMKIKTIHETTGEVQLYLGIVYEQQEQRSIHYIRRFAMYAGSDQKDVDQGPGPDPNPEETGKGPDTGRDTDEGAIVQET